MKHPITLEPNLRSAINNKKYKRKSTKEHRKIYHKINRRKLKENPMFDVVIFNKRIDYEF